ncbi:MAG: hypothetical protein M3Q65_24410, partial [Chloroflexota bacterium]|nr:hypothetical protein [Chloroflexota bacterium]
MNHEGRARPPAERGAARQPRPPGIVPARGQFLGPMEVMGMRQQDAPAGDRERLPVGQGPLRLL